LSLTPWRREHEPFFRRELGHVRQQLLAARLLLHLVFGRRDHGLLDHVRELGVRVAVELGVQ
jgi:hypothetical protein